MKSWYIKFNEMLKCIKVFAKSYCPYCKRVRMLFEEIEANYFVLNLDETGNIYHKYISLKF